MAQQIEFHNETHWRLTDIQRIVRLAMVEAGADMTESRIVRAIYKKAPPKLKKKPGVPRKRRKSNGISTNPSVGNVMFKSDATSMKGKSGVMTEVTLLLPRRGSKDPHPIAMVALAASHAVAGKVDEDATLLPFSDVYYLVNYLAYQFACEAVLAYEDEDGSLAAKKSALRVWYGEISCPPWADPSKLFIAKYKDPLKDATYQSFVQKKETAIKRETTTIARLEKEIQTAQKNLRAAKRRRKAAEKAIKDATERRTS